MAAPSGSVENLEDFIAELTKAQKKVESSIDVLGTHAGSLDDLEDKAGDELGALSDQIEDFQQQLESGTEDAIKDVEKVEDAAREIADERFRGAKDDLDGAVGDVEDRLTTDRDDLDNDATALNETGFRAMGETLDGIQADLQTAGQENDAAVDTFEEKVDKLGEDTGDRFDETEGKFDEALTALDGNKTALESAAKEGIQGLSDALTEIQGQCATLQGELDGVYDDAEQKIASEGDDLINSVRGLFGDAAQFVAQLADDSLNPAATAVLNEAAPAVDSELDELESLVDSATPVATETSAMSTDLSIAQSVVDTVKQMLDAMGG